MNKKAAVFHWIIFGVLVALGIFFVYLQAVDITPAKGQWPLQFMEQNYLPAEKELLHRDVIARDIGRGVLQTMATLGGFKELSPRCGVLGTINQWNDGDQFCFPEAQKNAVELAQKALKNLSGNFSEISFSGNYFSAKGPKLTMNSSFASYTYDASFNVNLSYDINDYEKLKVEALNLLSSCKAEKDVAKCVKEKKPADWLLGKCGAEWKSSGKVIPFCVVVYGKENLVPLRYQFALDFASDVTIPLESLNVELRNGLVTLSFPKGEASEYNLYYTDYTALVFNPGKASDVFYNVPSTSFLEKKIIKDALVGSAGCVYPNARVSNTAYLCGENVVYDIDDQKLQVGEHFFGVTSMVNGVESVLNELVKK